MKQIKRIALGAWVAASVAVAGCDRTDSTGATPPNTGTGITGAYAGTDVQGADQYVHAGPRNPAGAPSFGSPSGMGFSTGDAGQTGGGGSGLMGFHDTGADGTSGTISDKTDPKSLEEAAPGAPHGPTS